MEGIGTGDNRGKEGWGDQDSINGLRVTNYGAGGQVKINLRYSDNVIVIRGRDKCEIRGTELSVARETKRRLAFLDTFDWRLANAGARLTLESTGKHSALHWLSSPQTPEYVVPVAHDIRFASDLPAGHLRSAVEPLTEVRALLPIGEAESHLDTASIRDGSGKILLHQPDPGGIKWFNIMVKQSLKGIPQGILFRVPEYLGINHMIHVFPGLGKAELRGYGACVVLQWVRIITGLRREPEGQQHGKCQERQSFHFCDFDSA